MRTLIVEDDFISPKILQKYLSTYGECHIAVNGQEAIEAFKRAWEESNPYDLICMDIMMPELDGQDALRQIRQSEKDRGIKSVNETKVIMTSALDDPKDVVEAFYKGGASSYIVKPIDRDQFFKELKNLGLIDTIP